MRALVAYKKSTFEFYNNSPDPDVRAYVQGDSGHAKLIRRSHDAHTRSLGTVLSVLEKEGIAYTAVWRADLECVKGSDLVISVGGDGTFLDASHYLRGMPILGVNSDPATSVGYFCSTTADTFEATLKRIDTVPRTVYCRLELSVDGEPLPQLALNDVLFAHPSPAGYTKYDLVVDGNTERVGSSGLLISTAAGSTAWMYQDGGEVLPPESSQLLYHHRDRRGSTPQQTSSLSLVSRTREGRLFIDGESAEHPLKLGQRLDVRCGSPLTIIGDLSRTGY